MADFPAWDYWAWEQLPNGKQRLVETSSGFLSESDIRNGIYDLDVNNWCWRKNFFWAAQEAALISFGRDPYKVKKTDDDFVFHDEVYGPTADDEDDSQQKDNELRQHIADVYEAILHAQETGVLRGRKIPRERYIEWAQGEGIDVPRFVVEAVDEFERDRECEANEQSDGARSPSEPESRSIALSVKQEHFISAAPKNTELDYDALPPDALHLPHKKGRAPQTQLETNQTLIILGLLIRAKLLKLNTEVLSAELAKILSESSIKPVTKGTIHSRLNEARGLLKQTSV